MADDLDLTARLGQGNGLLLEGRRDEARSAFLEVWQEACDTGDHYAACAAAHMLGTIESTPPEERLEWHLASLERARQVSDGRVDGWYASIYINLGNSYRQLNRLVEALECYREGLKTQAVDDSPYSRAVRTEIQKAIGEVQQSGPQ